MFMAPEIWTKTDCSQKSDIFSLGLVLYFMIMLEPAFKDMKNPYEDKARLKKEITTGTYPPMDKFYSG